VRRQRERGVDVSGPASIAGPIRKPTAPEFIMKRSLTVLATLILLAAGTAAHAATPATHRHHAAAVSNAAATPKSVTGTQHKAHNKAKKKAKAAHKQARQG
jgi:hypothetical protein